MVKSKPLYFTTPTLSGPSWVQRAWFDECPTIWERLAIEGHVMLRQSFGTGRMFEVVDPFITPVPSASAPRDDYETCSQYSECTCYVDIDTQ